MKFHVISVCMTLLCSKYDWDDTDSVCDMLIYKMMYDMCSMPYHTFKYRTVLSEDTDLFLSGKGSSPSPTGHPPFFELKNRLNCPNIHTLFTKRQPNPFLVYQICILHISLYLFHFPDLIILSILFCGFIINDWHVKTK